MTECKDKPLDHDYDGIKELDNDLPRWWLYLFYATIIFAVIYLLYYHVFDFGYSSTDAYRQEMDPTFVRAHDQHATYFGILPRYRAPLSKPLGGEMEEGVRPAVVYMTRDTDTNTYVATMDEAGLAAGKEIFQYRCASCHGTLGEGGVGPNLTDAYWLHGAEFTHIVKSVRYGYPTQGMVAWLGQLKPAEILHVASYVTTLRGTNPPNAKAPQGEKVGD